MTIKLESVAVDLARESKGDWVNSLVWPGVRYNVSSLNVPSYVTARQLMFQRLQRRYKGDVTPPDVLTVEIGTLLAKHILHDWDGFDVPYSDEEALRKLTDPAFRALRDDVSEAAARFGEPDVEYVKEQEKNSEPRSAG